jgi:hypothetical protein
VVFLARLVRLQLKYRQRMPRYIWLIGSATALAFFCWRLSPMLLTQSVYLKSGYKGLERTYYSYNFEQMRSMLFVIYLVYTVGTLVWGAGMLLKGVLPRWIALLLMLFGVDSLLRWPVIHHEGHSFSRVLLFCLCPLLPSGRLIFSYVVCCGLVWGMSYG